MKAIKHVPKNESTHAHTMERMAHRAMFEYIRKALVRGLQTSCPIDGVVLAVVDDITLMGTLKAVVTMEASRSDLQKPPNYTGKPLKQHVYTVNEEHVEEIKQQLSGHDVFYIRNTAGFQSSGIPVGGEH